MFDISRENTGKFARWIRNINKEILFSVMFLFLLGLFFSFSSTSSIASDKLDKETYFFFAKHLFFVSISFCLLISISIQDRKFINKYLVPLFFISLILLFLVPFLGIEVKGSKRWLDFPLIPRFQPIEFLKPLFILITAKIITRNDKLSLNVKYFLSFLSLILIIALLITQPDFGQTLLIFFTWITMIFVSGINMFMLFVSGFMFLVILILVLYLFPTKFGYIFYRIQTFFDPSKGDNYQSQKALEAIKEGGLTGRGLGEGILKENVPEAHTDYIIAVVSEEFGVLIVLLIIFLLLFLTYKTINKVFLEEDEFIKLSLIGLISLLVIQAFIHMGVNIRLLPTTGMTFPFLSYGGSSLIGSSLISGIILNYTKRMPKRI